jgi:hypothetical protein
MEIISITTKKNKIFEKILEKCLDEIKDKQIKNEEYVLFCVPKVMSYLLYNPSECIDYVTQSLFQKHYNVRKIGKYKLLITWTKAIQNNNFKIISKIKQLYPNANIQFIYKNK